MSMKQTVLVYIENDNHYLLIHKQKPDMNFNKHMGVGGKIEAGETPLQAAKRETLEETGLTLINPTFRGEVYFHSNDYIEKMFLFTASQFTGELVASSEGDLIWVHKDRLKSLLMWEGDYQFLERLNQKVVFVMHLYYEGEKLYKVTSGPLASDF